MSEGSEADDQRTALRIEDAVNETCPWSGKPIAADSLTLYQGAVVGFCNPGCRDKFEAAVEPFRRRRCRRAGPRRPRTVNEEHMFESLSEKLSGILDKLTRRGALTEEDVNAAMREVRRALLEADVALEVVRSFTDKVRAERGRRRGHQVGHARPDGRQDRPRSAGRDARRGGARRSTSTRPPRCRS